ncbi:hypothetical protein Chor_013629 [Crotalus horridus]
MDGLPGSPASMAAAPAATYKIRVATGNYLFGGTMDTISISLVGTHGETPKFHLDKFGKDFSPGEVRAASKTGNLQVSQLIGNANTPCGHVKGCESSEINLKHSFLHADTNQGRYKDYQPGWPKCLDTDSVDQLHLSDQYSSIKSCSFRIFLKAAEIELKLKGLLNLKGSWRKLADIRRAFWFYRTPTSGDLFKDISVSPEYVSKHWDEDAFFGYQYLNGASPGIIQRCSEIPAKFPVTQEMVAESLGLETTLEDEVKLTQQPGPRSPIFLPTDPEWVWALAKFWVRNSTFYLHEILAHLLHTHLLVEAFLLATLRQLPKCHPVHKLLIPHFRYTLHINILGRTHLLAPGGMLDKVIDDFSLLWVILISEEMLGTGFQGLSQLVARGLSKLTYSMLCLPDDLRERGVDSLPNYYYKEDGLKLWNAIESFVSGMVGLYYPSDGAVEKDMELQAWVAEIFEKCFHHRQSSGTIAELTKYLTMMVFTCSVRHASVNNTQVWRVTFSSSLTPWEFDFGAWMPNYPSTMRRPPPESKGSVTFADIMETLPDRSLGYYPEEHFTEEDPKKVIATFQKSLADISREIEERNRRLSLPYNYLNPSEVANSISI